MKALAVTPEFAARAVYSLSFTEDNDLRLWASQTLRGMEEPGAAMETLKPVLEYPASLLTPTELRARRLIECTYRHGVPCVPVSTPA